MDDQKQRKRGIFLRRRGKSRPCSGGAGHPPGCGGGRPAPKGTTVESWGYWPNKEIEEKLR